MSRKPTLEAMVKITAFTQVPPRVFERAELWEADERGVTFGAVDGDRGPQLDGHDLDAPRAVSRYWFPWAAVQVDRYEGPPWGRLAHDPTYFQCWEGRQEKRAG